MQNIAQCPVCNGAETSLHLDVCDYFLTREHFSIVTCTTCGFRFVNPRPTVGEIGKYYESDKYISHNTEGFSLMTSLYRMARIVSLNGKYRMVKRYIQGEQLLDIGCGTGEFLANCRKHGLKVTGMEPTRVARMQAIDNNHLDVKENLEEVRSEGKSYHCITLWHVLEHIHDLNGTLAMIGGMLAPEGVVVVAVPNSNSWDAQHYGKYWAAYDVPRHLYHFTQETMERLVRRNGFKIISTSPQRLDAFYVSMLSEKYRHGGSGLIRGLFRGMWSNLMARRSNHGHSSIIFVLKPEKTQL